MGPHPRLWLSPRVKATLQRQAHDRESTIARAIQRCEELRIAPDADMRNTYMAFNWAANASTCALAYQITTRADDARTAVTFFQALLDDWETIGDRRGGASAMTHDKGYGIRTFGVHAAIAYDYLHDAPSMTPSLLAHARDRFSEWTTWYRDHGYRSEFAGTNYHAAYVAAATLIAIAQGSEAGARGDALWHHVTDDLWTTQMSKALAQGGILDGGDWAEGWQYGPLAVANYALAARAMIEQRATIPGVYTWTRALLRRHIHGLTPDQTGTFVGGDTQSVTANIAPHPWTLAAVAAGPSTPDNAAAAKHEIQRLHLQSNASSILIFEALAEATDVTPQPIARELLPTSYMSPATQTWFVRTSWSTTATWMAMQCAGVLGIDHRPPNAGNFVISRGGDDVIVDPSPYGSLSSLTSNAPAITSYRFPIAYSPSQSPFGVSTHFEWVWQDSSGVAAARCNYTDQFRWQDQSRDVQSAIRDIIFVPSDESSATIVVIDQVETSRRDQHAFIRFRSPHGLSFDESHVARGALSDGSLLRIFPAYTSGNTENATLSSTEPGDCFSPRINRGQCAAARFAVTDYAVALTGQFASAMHVIDMATNADSATIVSMNAENTIMQILPHGSKVPIVIAWFAQPARGAATAERAAAPVSPRRNEVSASYIAPPGHRLLMVPTPAPTRNVRSNHAQASFSSRDRPTASHSSRSAALSQSFTVDAHVTSQKSPEDSVSCEMTLKRRVSAGAQAEPLSAPILLDVSDSCTFRAHASSPDLRPVIK